MGAPGPSALSFMVFQPGLCPEDWLQDMERLSEGLLLPLLKHPSLGSLWDSLGYVLCVRWRLVKGGSLAPCGVPESIQLEGDLNP